MAKCAYCNSTILFGGARDGDLRFCNEKCHQQGILLSVASEVPDNVIEQHVWDVYQGFCPKCQGKGPVDVHPSHRVWSAVLLTSWSSTPLISCRRCGLKSQLGAAATSLLFGWWGIPWGLVLTPVQVGRNLVAMARWTETTRPSEALVKMVRLELASQLLDSRG